MSIIIRPFDPADAPAANAITNLHIRETHIHFGSEPASDAEFLESWRQRQPRFPWLAASSNGDVVGFARAGPWRNRDAYRYTAETAVYIHSDHHRRGIGRALMIELLARLSEGGFHCAIAGVALPNPASIALHEGLGFSSVGVFRDVGFKFGRWWDVGFWQISLPQPAIA